MAEVVGVAKCRFSDIYGFTQRITATEAGEIPAST